MRAKELPPLNTLAQHFNYEPDTGHVRWRVPTSNRVQAGSIAGKQLSSGYIGIRFHGAMLMAHRIAWVLHHKVPPPRYLDHQDNKRGNNKIHNLREATKTQNGGNSLRSTRNTSGFKGVSYRPERRKYAANIRVNARLKFLGHFDSALEAHEAYCKKARETWGAYSNPG